MVLMIEGIRRNWVVLRIMDGSGLRVGERVWFLCLGLWQLDGTERFADAGESRNCSVAFFWVLLSLLLVFVFIFWGHSKSEILMREMQKEITSGQFLYLYIIHFWSKHWISLNLLHLAKCSGDTWIGYVDSVNLEKL